jgi:DNA modification methylase
MKLDTIYRGDARHMDEIPDESVHLVVTSPPYNAGKKYDRYPDDLPLGEYLEFLRATWRECQRVLVPGGRIAINIANTGRKPYRPLDAYVKLQLIEMGFLLRGDIVWHKALTESHATAWGSYRSATNPVLRDVHEYIIVASKETYALDDGTDRDTDILADEFCQASESVWRIGTDRDDDHPCVFPFRLPHRLILFYSRVGDVVLDPFMGTGTTALAARVARRHYLGYEQSSKYVTAARKRVRVESEGYMRRGEDAISNPTTVRDHARRERGERDSRRRQRLSVVPARSALQQK